MEMNRKAVKFTETWAMEFSIIAQGTWTGLNIPGTCDSVQVSYLDTGLTDKQQKDFKTFLENRRNEQMVPWLVASVERLKSETLTKDWMEKTDVHKDLKFICNINITAVFNSPGEGKRLPSDLYPIAFMLA